MEDMEGEPRNSTCWALIGPLSSSSTPSWQPELWITFYTWCTHGTLYGTLHDSMVHCVVHCVGLLLRSLTDLYRSVYVKVCQSAANCSAARPASHVPLSGSWPGRHLPTLLSKWNKQRNAAEFCRMLCFWISASACSKHNDALSCHFALVIRSIDPFYGTICWHHESRHHSGTVLTISWAHLSSSELPSIVLVVRVVGVAQPAIGSEFKLQEFMPKLALQDVQEVAVRWGSFAGSCLRVFILTDDWLVNVEYFCTCYKS